MCVWDPTYHVLCDVYVWLYWDYLVCCSLLLFDKALWDKREFTTSELTDPPASLGTGEYCLDMDEEKGGAEPFQMLFRSLPWKYYIFLPTLLKFALLDNEERGAMLNRRWMTSRETVHSFSMCRTVRNAAAYCSPSAFHSVTVNVMCSFHSEPIKSRAGLQSLSPSPLCYLI